MELMNKNMIDRQLKPIGVNNELILDAFKSVPRELFVDKGSISIAYHEGNIEVKEGRCLLSAGLIGRLINSVSISKELVASSKRSTSGLLYKALAIPIRCLCPPEILTPLSPTLVSSPKGN